MTGTERVDQPQKAAKQRGPMARNGSQRQTCGVVRDGAKAESECAGAAVRIRCVASAVLADHKSSAGTSEARA